MDNEESIPKWIKQAKDENDRQKQAAETETQRMLRDTQTILAGAPEFWKRFLGELKKNADNLKEIGNGVRGRYSFLPKNENRPEESCHVDVMRESAFPKMTHIDIHYSLGPPRLRCYRLEGDQFQLIFCLDSQHNMAVRTNGHTMMDAKGAAQFIVEPMVNMVRAR
jgi:hypothetical protein